MTLTCAWLMEQKDDDPVKPTCGKRAYTKVTMQSRFAKARVALCPEHIKKHNKSAAETRLENKMQQQAAAS